MKKLVYTLLFTTVLSSWGFAQTGKPLRTAALDEKERLAKETTLARDNVYEKKLESKLMNRKMPYRVILPPGYSNSNETSRYPVIFLLHGLTGHYDNWTEKTKIAEYAKRHNYIIVTPEGANGWYTDSVSVPTDKFESYFIVELIPEIDKNYRTIADRGHRIVAGLSMGGYGSIKFGLKYPDKFFLVGSFSGALFAATLSEKNSGSIGKGIDAIYGPEESQTRRENDVFRMVRELTPEKMRTIPFIYQSCGTEDPLVFQNNREFDALLVERKVPHEYREHPGIHSWVFWDDQVREFLDLADRMMRK